GLGRCRLVFGGATSSTAFRIWTSSGAVRWSLRWAGLARWRAFLQPSRVWRSEPFRWQILKPPELGRVERQHERRMMRRLDFLMAGAALTAALFLGLASTSVQGAPSQVTIEECAYCHGFDGIAKERDVPHLAGQNEGYLFNQLMAFRSGKRAHKE